MLHTTILSQAKKASGNAYKSMPANAGESDLRATCSKGEMIKQMVRRLEQDGELSGKELFENGIIFSH